MGSSDPLYTAATQRAAHLSDLLLKGVNALQDIRAIKPINDLDVLDALRLVQLDMELTQIADLLGPTWDHLAELRQTIEQMIMVEGGKSDEPR